MLIFPPQAKWYNLAAIFIAKSRLQRPVVHALRPGPQTFSFKDLNVFLMQLFPKVSKLYNCSHVA